MFADEDLPRLPRKNRYTKSDASSRRSQIRRTHEWIRPEGAIGTMGITDHAQAELTDIVYVELPQVGTVLESKQAVAVVESVKAASDIYSPVSGEVVETNAELETNPALVNTIPTLQVGFLRSSFQILRKSLH